MKKLKITIAFSLLFSVLLGSNSLITPASFAENTPAPATISNTLVELFFMKEQKKNINQIKKEFQNLSIKRIRTNFYPAGKAVQILAIGRKTPSEAARLGIQIALQYNTGIKYLLPQILIPHNYVAIGTSAFDEKSQVAISAEDLKRLADPSLSTEAFHILYEKLTESFLGLYP